MKARTMATCAMISAMSIVIMLLGSILELGMYAAPMMAGLCSIPVGKRYGRKYQALIWGTVSLLSFILIPLPEQNLMFAGFFGWYPIVQPLLQRLPKGLRFFCKIALFNSVIIGIEALVMLVLVPEVIAPVFLVILLALANVTFVMYDFVIPRVETILKRVILKGK